MIKPGYQKDYFPHWSELQIRYRDLDTLNHVNNAIFNTLFEEARIRFIQNVPEFQTSMKSGNSFVLVNLEINFVEPVFYPSVVITGTGIASYGNSSITGLQAIYERGSKDLKAVAKSTGVWYNPEKKKPVKLPVLPDWEKYLIKSTE